MTITEQNRNAYLTAMGLPVWQPRARDAKKSPEKLNVQSDDVVKEPENDTTDIKINTEEQISGLDWPELSSTVVSCTACDLSTTRTQTVFGTGNKNADWLFIGEAPGAEEDKQGQPFVGRAGLLLSAMLFALGLERDDIYISNVLKCRPPNNRDPRPEEVSQCEVFLRAQINLIKPKVIIALGRHAAHSLLTTDKTLSSLRGQTHDFHGTPLVVTYHPAYLLRTPADKNKSWQDLCLANTVVQQ